jgi:hypothetical protein
LNPHTLRYRNLNPAGVYRNAANCSETRSLGRRSLPLASFRYGQGRLRDDSGRRHYPRSPARRAADGAVAFEARRAGDCAIVVARARLALVSGALAPVVVVVLPATKERRCTFVSGARLSLVGRGDADRLRHAVRRPAHVRRCAHPVDDVSPDDPTRLAECERSRLACHRP